MNEYYHFVNPKNTTRPIRTNLVQANRFKKQNISEEQPQNMTKNLFPLIELLTTLFTQCKFSDGIVELNEDFFEIPSNFIIEKKKFFKQIIEIPLNIFSLYTLIRHLSKESNQLSNFFIDLCLNELKNLDPKKFHYEIDLNILKKILEISDNFQEERTNKILLELIGIVSEIGNSNRFIGSKIASEIKLLFKFNPFTKQWKKQNIENVEKFYEKFPSLRKK
ncbi:hypothetical protein M0811_01242 [Anaeramoeba ignava]|uniref:Uncharacterized protein n=1 Tax=Anaeramoeba ignava TaxID=1746090 RepID=A0A9Q0LL36_ANAIG|nr:hypothetical protein M0811_01242 [Anaeramoeba ignava]